MHIRCKTHTHRAVGRTIAFWATPAFAAFGILARTWSAQFIDHILDVAPARACLDPRIHDPRQALHTTVFRLITPLK